LNNVILRDFSYIVSIIIEIGLPLILAFIIWKKFKVSWAIFFLGMVLFLASLIRIPLNNYVAGLIRFNFHGEKFIIISALFVSLAASLFEEGVRILAIGVIIKPRNFYKSIMYGIGHGGGGESMIFVGIASLINYILFRFFPNTLPAYTISQFQDINWYLPLVGSLERIFAITIQVSLSVMIMHAFLKRKFYFIAITIIYHFLIDFIAIYAGYKFGIMVTEIIIFVFAGVSIAIIFFLRPKKIDKILINY
jgi:uncharacterized membrane protein YhfC